MLVAVPYWFIAVLALPLPLIWVVRWRKRRRVAREGLCRVCGYGLRASVERCPECGTGIEAKGVVT
jgi:predicted amidophosphoribosyltransferase